MPVVGRGGEVKLRRGDDRQMIYSVLKGAAQEWTLMAILDNKMISKKFKGTIIVKRKLTN